MGGEHVTTGVQQGSRRKANAEYECLYRQIKAARARNDIPDVKRLVQERRKLASKAPSDPAYRRLRYIRYADDFLLGFTGPKKEAEEIRQRLAEFLGQNLKLSLSLEKTLITHAVDEKARFLGYEINVMRQGDFISANGQRATSGNIALRMPRDVVRKYHQRYSKGGKVIHRAELLADTDYTILQRYQAVLRGLYNYYCMAVNVGTNARMHWIRRLLETSLTKTLAHKFRCHVSEIYKRYQVTVLDRKMLRVVIERQNKDPLIAVFGGFPFERLPDGMNITDFSFDQVWHQPGNCRSEVVIRLLAGRCELCEADDVPVEVHHIRKLADIDRPGRPPKAPWNKIMAARKRKTLVVCRRCHEDITYGRYDGPPLG